MLPRISLALTALFLAASTALAFEVAAVIRGVDREKRVLTVFAGGRVRMVPLSADARFLDREGKPLAGGLASAELKDGAQVTLTVEPEGRQPTIRTVRLGSPANPAPAAGAAPAPVDLSQLHPLTDMADRKYRGYEGGLYPGGKNTRPAAHEAAGVVLASRIRPLDAEGRPAAGGKIVLLTLGMSNASQASQGFARALTGEAGRNPALVLVNGAQGGMTAARTQDPNDMASGTQYWTEVDRRLTAAGVSRAQVQAAWIKQADAGPSTGFPAYAKTLQAELVRIAQILPARFPNLKALYLSSRTFGGYARSRLNPEPYAFESGYSVKWLIEQQIQGDTALNYDPAKGPVRAPWLSWGPYLWARGDAARSDGFRYQESDFAADGTHQSESGQRKVGDLLLQFFRSDSTTRGWFTGG